MPCLSRGSRIEFLRRRAQGEFAGSTGEPGHHAGRGGARQALIDRRPGHFLHQSIAPEVIAGQSGGGIEGALIGQLEDGAQARQQRLRLGMGGIEGGGADAESRGIAGHGPKHDGAGCCRRQRGTGDVDGDADQRLVRAPVERAKTGQRLSGRCGDQHDAGALDHRLIVRHDPGAEAGRQLARHRRPPGREQDRPLVPRAAQTLHHEAGEPADADDAERSARLVPVPLSSHPRSLPCEDGTIAGRTRPLAASALH